MHETQAIRATARKRDASGRKHQGLQLKTNRQDGRQSGAENGSGNAPASPDRKRVETVVETLSTLRSPGETLAEVAHDARNMVTALGLYCDLLDEPGVLATPFLHYGQELRLVAAASRRLVEKIVTIDSQSAAGASVPPAGLTPTAPNSAHPEPEDAATAVPARDTCQTFEAAASASRRWDLLPAVPVANLAAELLANRNLLAALAGPSIALTVHAEGGAQPVRLSGEDLTRVLVNLVKNSTEAMPSGGRIHIGLREQPAAKGAAACLLITVEDNGPGISAAALETIFASGYSTHGMGEGQREGSNGNWALSHRGLGLTISRSIVEGAGGRITAGNREQGGARISVELPLRKAS